MPWYMAEYNSETDHEYVDFPSDEEAISGFTSADDSDVLQAIYLCADDECLTPEKLIWH